MDDLSLVEPIDRFGERIVVAVAEATDGRLDTRLSKALGVSNTDVLRTSVEMVHQATTCWPPFVKRLFQCVEHEACMRRSGDAPADDATS